MDKKVAIVTGANGGMGAVITKKIAQEGYHVIMACRNLQKSQPIMEKIKRETGASIQLLHLDLASFDSIKSFVQTVTTQYNHLDLLLNNAGTLCHKPETTIHNIEMTVGVNYLGHYTLSYLLHPIMQKGTRVVNMVSLTYRYGKIDSDIFIPKDKPHFNRFTTYSDSKLAFLYFTLDASEKWKNEGITVNCADPGIVSTNIIRMGNVVVDKLCDIFFRPIIKSPAKGAATMLDLALNPNYNDKTGCCHANLKEILITDKIRNNDGRLLLRRLTDELLKQNNIDLP